MDVKKIPVNVQCLLSASAKVNSYKRAVEELVYNSVDAESTSVAIRLHIQNDRIQVVDNGCGIKKADFKLLGERYTTSKLPDVNTLKAMPNKYGYQGQALANIIEVSRTVKITSRSANSDDTWVKTFLEGRLERKCFKAPTRPSKGTTVEIHGFLYNLNIRKKYINAFNELQDIKTFLEQLLLVFNNLSISLRDDSENEIIFKMHKNRDIYQSLKSLFDIDRNDIQELQVEKNEYRVKGFIGIEKRGIKNWHWIYLNNKFINISNIHKIINNKFVKSNHMKDNKTKTKVACGYNEENSAGYDSLPFYFLFITCPYYEYFIINSGKQTTIEFKDWIKIDNLLEKLIKFYNGDINLISVQKNYNQNQILEKTEDTRGEVKKIMEKILGRPNKTAKVSQMQNGIQGKRVRRKRKKQQVNISLTKIIPPQRKISSKNFDTIKLSKNEAIKNASKYCDFKLQSNLIKKNSNSNNNPYVTSHKITKSPIKCKCKKKYENLIDIFNNDTYSNERRCKEIPNKVQEISRRKMRNKCPINQNKQKKCINTELEVYIDTKPAYIKDFKQIRNNKKAVTDKMTSYDLLQTIINSQKHFYNEQIKKENTFMNINNSNVRQQTCYDKYHFTPDLTFVSHKYNINRAMTKKELPQQVQFISKQTGDNFNIGEDKRKGNIRIKSSKISKHHGLFNAKNKKKRDTDKFKRLFNNFKEHKLNTSVSMNITGTDIIEFSKQIRDNVMNDMNSLFDNRDCDKVNDTKTHLNFGVNMNIEGTYTIISDSFGNSSKACNKPENLKSLIDRTISYRNVSYCDTTHNDYAYKTSQAILISESKQTPKLNIDEPLDICEAVLNSPNENDFDNSFNMILQPNSSLIVKEPENTNNSTIKSHINSSKNKTSAENSAIIKPIRESEENNNTAKAIYELSDQIRYKNDKFTSNEVNAIQNKSFYNFKLNTRHRFVPKGMSQIFKNCFTKNICSYNLETDYYENTIYNNFMEDVAVNSEIFEPNVQNLKEFATEDIQKITEKVKKRNADLTFGPDSLRSAKILGQVDHKFIAAIICASRAHSSPEFLVFFDQHAVHERIRLEKNLSRYFSDNYWKSITIDTISLKISKDDILYLHNHKDKYAQFGLEWTVLSDSEILVNAIPEAILGKKPRPVFDHFIAYFKVDIIIKTVKDLISEQIHAIKYLKGNISLYPQSIMNLIFNEACRYAIKFGDILSIKECVELIAVLANCKTPFQCAHGRPVMAVMVELKKKQTEYKTKIEKIMQFKNRIK